MASASSKLNWCVVRAGEDCNWWVEEISNEVQWDVDGLSILDPKQISYILDLLGFLRDYGFRQDLMGLAFFSFRVGKVMSNGRVRLERVHSSLIGSDEKLFALPDLVDDEKGPYVDFLDHITKLRVKMLNDLIDFEQRLTVEELEGAIREERNNAFMEGSPTHVFTEITAILEYLPEGYDLDEEEKTSSSAVGESAFGGELPEFEEETMEADETMKWEEEEEKMLASEEETFSEEEE